MKKSIDTPIAMDFVLAAGTMMSRRFDQDPACGRRPLMFTTAAAGDEGDLHQLARDGGHDLVCLAFRPGREQDGPTNIAVYVETGGEVGSWKRCFLWASTRTGPCYLISRDEEACFSYDGRSIVLIEGWPSEGMEEGVEIADALLRLMVQRVPPHVRITRRVDGGSMAAGDGVGLRGAGRRPVRRRGCSRR